MREFLQRFIEVCPDADNKIDPADGKRIAADAFFWLASMRSDKENFAEAEPLARKSVELNPNSWQANSELARALVGLNRPAEAQTSARAALKLRPDNALLYLIIANAHSQL